MQHFYESCKSLDYIESDREKPLIKVVNNLGGWDVLRTFNLYNWDPHRYLSGVVVMRILFISCKKCQRLVLE